jgi:DNA-binding transcriptional ArsR family regulator
VAHRDRAPAPAGNPYLLSGPEADEAADAMFALSTPSRIQILSILRGGPLGVNEMVEVLGLEQSLVSHQLRILREHSLIRAERQGRRRVYALSDDQVEALLDAALRHVGRHSRAETSPRREMSEPGSA